jgi:hypothetical protein
VKIKALVLALFLTGLLTSFALGAPRKDRTPPKQSATTTTTTSTTTTSKKPKCDQVELKGSATAGSITFTVAKANKRGRNLVGTAVTLAIPAGSKIKAKACSTAGGPLTLRDLHVNAPRAQTLARAR